MDVGGRWCLYHSCTVPCLHVHRCIHTSVALFSDKMLPSWTGNQIWWCFPSPPNIEVLNWLYSCITKQDKILFKSHWCIIDVLIWCQNLSCHLLIMDTNTSVVSKGNIFFVNFLTCKICLELSRCICLLKYLSFTDKAFNSISKLCAFGNYNMKN